MGAEKSDFRNHARFSQLIQLSLEEALRDLKTLRAENAAAHGSISALEAEKTKLESQIISFRKDPALRQVTSMQQELSRKDKQQNQYKDMFESLQSDYNKVLVSNEKAFAQINQLQDEKDQAAQESKQFFQGIQTALEEVSRDLETLKLKKAELESKVRHLKGANSKLDSRRRKLEEVNTLLQTELLNIQGLRTPRELNQEGTPGKDPGGSKFLGMGKQNIFSFNSSSWSDREKMIQSRDENETVAEEMNETDPDGNLSLQAEIRDESDGLSGLVAQKREIEAQITFIGEAKAVFSGMRSQATTLTKMENHESALQEQVSTIETKMEKLRAVKEASVDKRVAHSGEVQESLEGLNSEKGGVLVSTLRSLSRGPPGKYPATHPKNKISNLRIDSALAQKNE